MVWRIRGHSSAAAPSVVRRRPTHRRPTHASPPNLSSLPHPAPAHTDGLVEEAHAVDVLDLASRPGPKRRVGDRHVGVDA